MTVELARTRWRGLVAIAVAVPVLLLAVDLAITDGSIVGAVLDGIRAPDELDDLTRPPETGEQGGITHQGRSEQRADIAWGLVLGAGGLLALVWGANELTRSRLVVRADDEGLRLAVGSNHRGDVLVPWDRVDSIRSTREDADHGGGDLIEVAVRGPTWLPTDPRGARWEGNRLLIDATNWRIPAHEAAGLLVAMLERSRAQPSLGQTAP